MFVSTYAVRAYIPSDVHKNSVFNILDFKCRTLVVLVVSDIRIKFPNYVLTNCLAIHTFCTYRILGLQPKHKTSKRVTVFDFGTRNDCMCIIKFWLILNQKLTNIFVQEAESVLNLIISKLLNVCRYGDRF